MTAPVYNGPNRSTASGVSDTFPYDFKILQASDLLVTVDGLPRVLNTHYTVTGVGNPAGGNVVFDPGHLPGAGQIVDRRRNMPIRRDTNYLTLGDLLAATLNDDQDAPVLMIQQLLFSTLQLILDPDGSGEFVWDAQGSRIIRVGDATADQDAVNLRSLLTIIEQIQAGGGVVGVEPVAFTFTGDGVEPNMPIPGANVSNAAMYDTYVELTPGAGDFVGVRPSIDFDVSIDTADPANSVMPFTTPLGDGIRGFSVLRGYARPYIGPQPITTTALERVVITGDTTLDRSYHNKLIVIDEAVDVELTMREATGSVSEDWQAGEYCDVLVLGTGKVTVVAEGSGTVTPPDDFNNENRAQHSMFSVTCRDGAASAFATAGDLLRDVVEPSKLVLWLDDRSVLIGTNATTGTTKDSFIMPFDFQLDAIADRGCYAGLAVAQAAGSVFTVDVNVNGTSILTTKLTFDNGEKSTLTAATPPVYDTTFNTTNNRIIAAGSEVTIDIDQVGTALAKGLRVYLRGSRAN